MMAVEVMEPWPLPLVVVVRGLPAPQGSKRHVGNGIMVESSKRVKPWRQDVKHAAEDAMERAGWVAPVGPVALRVEFTMPRPRSHYRTGKLAHQLRDDAPARHGKTPDLDKLLRSTLDALVAGGVLSDDRTVASVVAEKWYGTTPGARIVMEALR